MKTFVSDLWQDLREKRLWPVAVVLLAGLVAVPVLLAKPFESPAPEPAPAQTAAEVEREADAELARVKLGEDVPGSGSTLGVFDPANPFKPPSGTIKKEEADGGFPDGVDMGGGVDPGAGAPTVSGGADGADGAGGGEEIVVEDDVEVDEGGGDGGDAGGETTTVYKYVVDLTFSANGRERRMKGLEKLDVLPNQASPLLIFMGVTAQGADAVFLVDSTLQAAGEGRCEPSESECAFAYIGAGSEFEFTREEGDSYTVLIDEIRRVEVQPEREGSGKAEGATANAALGGSRRFAPPIIADLVVVARERLDGATDQADRQQGG